MIKIKEKGDLEKATRYLSKCKNLTFEDVLNKYGKIGVAQLKDATPVDTGLTAASWDYYVVTEEEESRLVFTNTNIQNGIQVAILIQHGHATKNGGFVAGRDYINPVIQPIFDAIANQAWKEVSRL